MFIPVAKVQELIDIANKVDQKDYEDGWDKRIHVRDIAATLQKLIDDELDELDKMADEFQANRQDDAAVAQWESDEAGRAEMDWAHQEKKMDSETKDIFNWPGGL